MSPTKQSPRGKKKEGLTKKAPGAPKRFKSSYILFFMHVQEEIKKSLPPGTHTAPVVSKKASELWRNLGAGERSHWDNEAAKEKKRYIAEKESYTGPWQVPHTRAKKDPTAPRRNPSAFLLYSVNKRKEIKKENPDLKTTDISRMLGRLWRETSEEEKRPYVEREEIERVQYKEKMGAWKKKKEMKDREEAEKRKQVQDEAIEAKKLADDFAKENVAARERSASYQDESRPRSADGVYQNITSPPQVAHPGADIWWKWTGEEPGNPQENTFRRHDSPVRRQHQRTYHQHSHAPHDNHHPGRIVSHPPSTHSSGPPHQPARYSPIPLYRDNMFCPSPIMRHSEGMQYHQPDDIPSRGWPVPPQSYNQGRPSIEVSFSQDGNEPEFDRYERPNQLYKHDPELDCSPIGSYDEFDTFDPVRIH